MARSLEIIGWDDEARQLFSTSYDDQGRTLRFQCALDGHDWRIDGKGFRFRGAFGADWNNVTSTWELTSDGSLSPWMDIELTRAN